LYAFGGMWVRTPEMRAAYQAMVERHEQPALPARFVVPVPGCVCHSDDPVLQAQHARRRLRECSSCH
jgi:enamine deaminase RidA (YjgF/YER057c/UK114 family)